MINSIRSEHGWRGGRRIALLVFLVSALAVAGLGTAGTASAAIPAGCKAKLTPNSKSNPGPAAELSFVCDTEIRTYGLGSNRRVKDYASTPTVGGTPSTFMSCEGFGPGFGCGIFNRAIAADGSGTQDPFTTGWKKQPVPPYPSATTNPTTCGGFKRVATGPNRDGIVNPPCAQRIPAGTTVTQSVMLGTDPCNQNPVNPLKLFLMVGGEPFTTSFTTGGDSTVVGESISPPYPVKLKGYAGCQNAAAEERSAAKEKAGGKREGAQSAAATTSNFSLGCGGTVESAVAGQKNNYLKFLFSCSRNIRAFAIFSNVKIDLGAEEPTVVGTAGGAQNESALHQCEGFYPGPGFGCGITNRQEQTAVLPNGSGISAGNIAEAKFGITRAPCKRPGEPKARFWVVAMGEPIIGDHVGEYISAPFELPVTGYGKCKSPVKK